jgi:hypothetical protein
MKAKHLIIAFYLLLIACMTLDLYLVLHIGDMSTREQVHFKHFTHIGNKPWCMVDYTHKTIACMYDDRNSCYAAFNGRYAGICWRREDVR